jgi:putative PIN family toxin of toxin-antitoxin system
VTEINQVLSYPKIARVYQTTTVGKDELIQQVLRIGKVVQVTSEVDIITEHASDNKFLECALDSKANYVVSGDRHLLNVVAFRKIKMMSVSGFLELIT